jgi:hypothetical protein
MQTTFCSFTALDNCYILRYLILFLKEHGPLTYGDLCASYVDTMNKVNPSDVLVSFCTTKFV